MKNDEKLTRLGSEKPKKPGKHLDNLTRDVLEAERLGYGCHYGRYKADHPHTPTAAPAPRRAPEKDKTHISERPRTCAMCGKTFYSSNPRPLKYCGPECAYEANQMHGKERYRRHREKMKQEEMKND